MTARALMVQGTTSDAGKSLLVTALCRWLHRRGVAVAPFKPQNMALNSAVTVDGGEIGRAQAVQARACGLEPHTDMNPVLLKPTGDLGSQVVVHGRAIGNMAARDYHAFKPRALEAVLASYERLRRRYEAIVVEGAGSPAEINLRTNDIANMGFAEAVDCPVVLIADIDRGGVFAHLVGTLALLSPSERTRVRGVVVNRFRGDPGLLESGLRWFEARTGKPVLGVLPHVPGLVLDAEDSLALERPRPAAGRRFRVVVPALPRISNHTDLDALRLRPDIDLRLVGEGETIPPADLIVLPGSKAVRADLDWLRRQGWESAIHRHLRYGGRLLGLCGGYQMLGERISDPDGVEGDPGSSPGLGLLRIESRLTAGKTLARRRGRLLPGGEPVGGYEIHAGHTDGPDRRRPLLALDDHGDEGARSPDGLVAGTYLHGLFDRPEACAALLAWAGLADAAPADDLERRREATIETLAGLVDAHLDTRRLLGWFGLADDAA